MSMSARRYRAAEALLGVGVAALGAFVAVETSTITVSPVYAKVGPQAIPYIVAGGLIVLGLSFAGAALRAPAPPDAERRAPTDWLPLLAISVGLVAQMLLLEPAGFVIAAAVLFFCVAFGFGSRRYVARRRDRGRAGASRLCRLHARPQPAAAGRCAGGSAVGAGAYPVPADHRCRP